MRSGRKRKIIIGFNKVIMLVIALLVCDTAAIAGYVVKPVALQIVQGRGPSSHAVQVQNTGEKPITLEVKVEKRTVNTDGTESFSPADEQFIVLPPQFVIPPGSTQSMRVQYAGPPVDEGVSYLMTIMQLPVDLPEITGNGINILVNFAMTVMINPSAAKSSIKINKTTRSDDGKSAVVYIENVGNKIVALSSGEWSVTSQGKNIKINPGNLAVEKQSIIVPPNSKRIFKIRLPSDLPKSGDLSAQFVVRD